jgi:signal transduction histidine kinase
MTDDQPSVARIEALLEEQAALRRVATLAAGDPEPRHLFDRVCEEVGHLLEVESTDMVRFDGEGSATVVAAWAAEGGVLFPAGVTIPVAGETVTAKLCRSCRPERVDDYSKVAGEVAAMLREKGILSVVGVPITVTGRLWGAVMASSSRTHAFGPETEHRLADFAELVTAALANADAREQLAASRARLVQAGYEERRRLGRDLHDGAQQELVGAAMSLRLAEDRLPDAPDEARELVAAAREQLQAGLGDLRELAAGIHPAVLADRGLSDALNALAARSPVAVELGEVPRRRLPDSVETTAYFVVAEALTNAAKHARCDVVEVGVRVENGSAVVEVHDDGVGGADLSAGSGLRGLADRVSALGGGLEIESPDGAGTTIRARMAVAAGNPRA